MASEKDKANLAAKGLNDFFAQFGSDEHARALIEVLFEGLVNEEAVFIFGEQKQAGNQTDYDPKGK